MDITVFRTNFPEFADTSVYPNAQITFWATLAEKMLPQQLWGDVWTNGVQLYVAHEVVLAAQNVKTAQVGGAPGQSGGIANNKTVGSVTVGYDSTTQSEKDAGWWNRTTYGQQLYRLIKIFGAGCVQL